MAWRKRYAGTPGWLKLDEQADCTKLAEGRQEIPAEVRNHAQRRERELYAEHRGADDSLAGERAKTVDSRADQPLNTLG